MPSGRLFARRWLGTIVCSLAFTTFVSGLSGFVWQYYVSPELPSGTETTGESAPSAGKDWSIPIYKTVQLFLLNSGAEDDAAHPSNWLLTVARLSDDYERRAVASGDKAAPESWSASRDDFRESNRLAADHLLIKLAVLGLELRRANETGGPSVEFDRISKADSQLLAEMEHYRWVAERLLAGWRFAPEGKTKEEIQANKRRKLNHNIVSWKRLGPDRQKDFDQLRTVLRECHNGSFSVARLVESQG